MTVRKAVLSAIVLVGLFAAVFAVRYAMYGCVADRFGRCIEWWMLRDYPVGLVVAGVLGVLMGAWKTRGEST
ncbi:hypothetical protein [Haloarcula amylovorans]|uniref:hypothetical protein n=1 Tax=Haloarcula amylovorans TaxID=2562280 RepID=UPI0010765F05|nr:hypothetical protein [Halomicroarcula amylolytica]